MSSLDKILTTAASGMSAESIRLNTIASNLANADGMGGSEDTTYRTKYPVFSEVKQRIPGLSDDDQPIGGVRVTDVQHSLKPLEKRYDPDNPVANKEGYVYLTDVNSIEQMTDMISASKEYQANVDVMNTTKNLISQTISVLNTKD
jgi:flagellar basal-body rod protein FlgC